MNKSLTWRGKFDNAEYHTLHDDAFGPSHESGTVDWQLLTGKHSMGWVTARDSEVLVGFVNVIWDGHLHAWIQDLMVAPGARHEGIGTELVREVRNESLRAGCEWLHVDFEDHLVNFYVNSCGFDASSAGLINLKGRWAVD